MAATSAPTTRYALEVDDLVVMLDGQRIIDHISFRIPVHETTAIIGPNGAGKSVLLRAILRLLPKQGGVVRIFGTPHEQYRKVAPLVSYIPQKMPFDRTFPLTVAGLFQLKSRQRLGVSAADVNRMRTLLALVGMENYASHKISTLSGGQLQRVLLAYSLMDHPQLLLLDEPAAGIDMQGQETIYTLLQRIQQQEGLTLLLVSHELDIVMRFATQVLCLNRKLLCAGVPREILSPDILEQMYGTPISHFTHHHD